MQLADSKKKKISIVIATYNHLEDCLKPCLEALFQTTDLTNAEIIIVANGCVDGTREYLNTLAGKVKTIWIDEPSGFTKSNNIGIKMATGEYIVLLNNDAFILPWGGNNHWLDLLLDPFEHDPLMGMTGSGKMWDKFAETDFIVFACAMIKRSVFDKVGLLNEVFNPGIGEDIEFGYRVLQAGYHITEVPPGQPIVEDHIQRVTVSYFPIFHKSEATFKCLPDHRKLLDSRRIMLMNMLAKGPKLNLGSGNRRENKYINIDLEDPTTDLFLDCTKLDCFRDNLASEILASHIIEHLEVEHVLQTLKNWHRILKPGGKLHIECPDFYELARRYVLEAPYCKDQAMFGKQLLLTCVYGLSYSRFMNHRWGWDEDSLRDITTQAGFKNFKRVAEIYTHPGYNMAIECEK